MARRKPGAKPRLTVDEVLQTALKLIDNGPPGGFTMAELAKELGVGVMTLYGYVRSKQELLDGVAKLAFDELETARDTDRSWQDHVRNTVREIYAVLVKHPHLLQMILAESYPSPPLDHVRERLLGSLRNAGFKPEAALAGTGILASYIVGFAGMQGAAREYGTDESQRRLQNLPPAEFPHLHEVANSYPYHLSDEAFEHGLLLLVQGLSRDLPTPRNHTA